MRYQFLVETYETERIKVVSIWSEFREEDLPVRPRADDRRGRSVREQMVHQCVSEDLWFRTMLGIDVGAPPLPAQETRLDFIKRYTEDSEKRLQALRGKPESWFEEGTKFFDAARSMSLGAYPTLDAYFASSRPADGHAADAGARLAQQLRADRGHRRLDAKSRAYDLCILRIDRALAGRITRWSEECVTRCTCWRCDGASGSRLVCR